MTLLPIPSIGAPRPVKLPAITDVTLASGLRVLVARRPAVPRFEFRLVVPIIAKSGPPTRVYTETLLSGTENHDSEGIAQHLQGMGGSLSVYGDADQLILAGSAMTVSRKPFLGLLGEIIREARFPAGEVAIERERIVEEIALQRSQPGAVAADALGRRMYGSHPYGWGIPSESAVARVSAATLRKLHSQWFRPAGALLVMVGDLNAARVVKEVEAALAGWSGRAAGDLNVPVLATDAPLLIDRPGSVQTTIRMAGPALRRTDPGYPALALAITAFGGYFTSRLNDNIREQKGYTYGAHARIDHRRVSSQVGISTDVGREVTAAALVEIAYELGRMVVLPITDAELTAAKRYLQGAMALGIQTQSGLTAYLAGLVSAGLPVTYLRDYPKALEHVTVTDVQAAAARFLAPSALSTVLVGDAAVIADPVAALGPVVRATERLDETAGSS